MQNENRDWQTFNQRWSRSSRIGLFLPWSLAVHAVLLALIVGAVCSAALFARQEQKKRHADEKIRIEEQKKELTEKVDKELQTLLKKELAREELHKLFDEVTEEFLEANIADAFWDELTDEFDFELNKLTDLFNDAEDFNLLKAEEQIQKLKEQFIHKMADLAAKKHLDPLKNDVLKNADKLAKQLADFFKKGLEETVGQPVGAEFSKTVDAEKKAAQAALQRADQELANLDQAGRNVLAKLKAAQSKFKAMHDAAKNDKKALAGFRQDIQQQRLEIMDAGRQLRAVQSKLKIAAHVLGPHLPNAAQHLKDADGKHAATAGKQMSKAMASAAKSDLSKAAIDANAAAENAKKTFAAIQRVAAAVKLQLAGSKVNQLDRDAEEQAKAAKGLAGKQVKAGKDKTKLAALAKDLAATATKTNTSASNAKNVEKQIAEANTILQLPFADKLKTKLTDAKALAGQAAKKLQDGKNALANKQPGKAADKLAAAAVQLKELGKDINKALAGIGLDDKSTPQALLVRLNQLSNDKLAKEVDATFAKAMKEKALPALMKKVQAAVDAQLKRAGGLNVAVRKEIQKVVQKKLGLALLENLKAADNFKKGVGAKLPLPVKGAKGKEDNGKAADQAGKAEAKAKYIIDRSIAALTTAASRQFRTLPLGKGKTTAAQYAAFLNRLDNFKNQLKAGRKDFLGQSSAAGIAAVRQRHMGRKASLSRSVGGLRSDLKAYRNMVEAIKDRGRIIGTEFERKGAKGDVSKADQTDALRPALVAFPEPIKPEPKPKTLAKRKVEPPSFKTHRFAGMPFVANDAVKIDGDLSDWKDIPVLKLDPVVRGGTSVPVKARPAHQNAHVAYCPKGLLVALDVVDTSGKLENKHTAQGSFWLNDGVEIYLDTLNTKYGRRGETNTHQFFAFPFGSEKDPKTGGYESVFYMENGRVRWKNEKPAYPLKVMPRAAKKTEYGWTMEILIPKSVMRRGEVKPGRIIGLNLQVDTGTNIYYFWTCNIQLRTSMHPDTWGDVQFLGSDAKIELISEDGKDKATSIVPGQPVRVRVTDPDMNLNDDKKDKISVMVRAASGDSETMVLEETEKQSGVFQGSLATRLNIGAKEPNRIEVFEGETVHVEYIDQARAFGERNVPLRVPFAVSSIGTRIKR